MLLFCSRPGKEDLVNARCVLRHPHNLHPPPSAAPAAHRGCGHWNRADSGGRRGVVRVSRYVRISAECDAFAVDLRHDRTGNAGVPTDLVPSTDALGNSSNASEKTFG